MDICELINNSKWGELRHPWERARVKVVANKLKAQFREKAKTLQIVDIGSGDAYLVYELTKVFASIKVHCIDIEYTEEIKSGLKENIGSANISLYNSLDDYKKANSDNRPDVILLLDVIEHIEDDRGFLKNLVAKEIAGLNTRFFITVPAYQSLFSAHDVFLKHYRRYTIPTLMETIESCNLESEKRGYFFFSLYFARSIQKTFNIGNNENAQKGVSSYKPVFIADKLIYSTLLMDYHFFNVLRKLGINSSGLSCYTICRIKKGS